MRSTKCLVMLHYQKKHCNFLINKEKASSDDMKSLINFVKDKVYKKTGVKLELEIILTS